MPSIDFITANLKSMLNILGSRSNPTSSLLLAFVVLRGHTGVPGKKAYTHATVGSPSRACMT